MSKDHRKEIYLLLTCFIVSRGIIKLLGVSFEFDALFQYWQYLDVQSLQHNLLNSLWYQHSQPPVFNLLLGVVLKCSSSYAPRVFEYLFMLFSFLNACLLLSILKNLTQRKRLPLFLSMLYLLSPATMLYENELFYTSFISLLLLVSIYFLIKFKRNQSWFNVIVFFSALVLLCLTRSIFHLLWLGLITVILLVSHKKIVPAPAAEPVLIRRGGFRKILITASLSLCLVGGWYVKNYLIFSNFSASSWVGINFSRIVFHDIEIKDTASIASVHPFLPIRYYRSYISEDYKKKYAGLNDRILLQETKNDSFINMNHAGYLEVSKKYMAASKDYVKEHPLTYLKNALKAFIIFFSPASSYFQVQENNNRIKYYDLVYSFNLSHFYKEKEKKRIALVVSAIPKFCMYLLGVLLLIRMSIKRRSVSIENILMIFTILFVLGISTIFEYGENMRFRYEVEPFFLILAAQVLSFYRKRISGF